MERPSPILLTETLVEKKGFKNPVQIFFLRRHVSQGTHKDRSRTFPKTVGHLFAIDITIIKTIIIVHENKEGVFSQICPGSR